MTSFSSLSLPARNELWACLALRYTRGIGPRRAQRLLRAYGSALAAAETGLERPADWVERGIVSLGTAQAFAAQKWRGRAEQEWEAIRSSGCGILCWTDAGYPELLRELDDPPLLLSYFGDISLLGGPSVGVVGARDCTREGIAVSAFFSRDLSKAGVTIISGMARGIDRAAHLAGLEEAGASIAVLGTGVDVVYPSCNADLYALLREKGLLISEFPPGTQPAAAHFPVRNRLISGLSQGVLVVEAARRSGSLITARLAVEQNRDVFAVPGHTMAAVSEGCRELIRRGAKPVFHADDILLELAPLLSYESGKALHQRQEDALRPQKAPARNRRAEPYLDIQTEASPVLPEGGLPWQSPCGSDKKTAMRPGKSGPDRGTEARFAPVHSVPHSFGKVSEEESKVLAVLSGGHKHIDDITRTLQFDVAKLSGMLTLLEVRGLVNSAPGMYYFLPEH